MIIAILAAAALSPPVAADARCIALMNFMIAKGTPEQKTAARAGTIYFVGKLKGRQPGIDVAAVLRTAAEDATRSKMNAQAEVKRCGQEVSAAADSLRPAGAPAAATPRKP
ncbi:hypothetical protein [uncultured Sphingomonas sp.]|uniref:hypothetical protein n=1 Tax=uncultured Sphingomonas sp. TaxID=158754 RepID=UPI0035CBDAFF